MSYAGASIAGGGAARGRSRSFGRSRSSIGADGNGAGVFVRAGAQNEMYVRADKVDLKNLADNEMYVRADKIDLKNLDVQLERTRSQQVWMEHQRSQRAASPRPETPLLLEWEVDIAKLEMQNQIAHGTFGVVYRGTYDGHDVAGTIRPFNVHIYVRWCEPCEKKNTPPVATASPNFRASLKTCLLDQPYIYIATAGLRFKSPKFWYRREKCQERVYFTIYIRLYDEAYTPIILKILT